MRPLGWRAIAAASGDGCRRARPLRPPMSDGGVKTTRATRRADRVPRQKSHGSWLTNVAPEGDVTTAKGLRSPLLCSIYGGDVSTIIATLNSLSLPQVQPSHGVSAGRARRSHVPCQIDDGKHGRTGPRTWETRVGIDSASVPTAVAFCLERLCVQRPSFVF